MRFLGRVPYPVHNSKKDLFKAKAKGIREQGSGIPTDYCLSPKERAAPRKRLAQLIRRVYLTDALICRDCGGEFRVIAFITEARIIEES
jgi:hypothetical protein